MKPKMGQVNTVHPGPTDAVPGAQRLDKLDVLQEETCFMAGRAGMTCFTGC